MSYLQDCLFVFLTCVPIVLKNVNQTGIYIEVGTHLTVVEIFQLKTIV